MLSYPLGTAEGSILTSDRHSCTSMLVMVPQVLGDHRLVTELTLDRPLGTFTLMVLGTQRERTQEHVIVMHSNSMLTFG